MLPAPFLGVIRVRVRPSVFNETFITFEAPALTSVADILETANLRCPPELTGVAWLNGQRLPQRYWRRVRPKAGTLLCVAFLPGDARTGIMIAGTLALAVATPFLGPVLGPLAFMAGTVALTLGVNALLPPPDKGKSESEEYERTSIGSVSNQLRLWEPVPVVCGRNRVVPPLAARPYSLLRDGDLYSHYLLAVSCGRTDISDLKFGETPIGEFDDLDLQVFEGGSGDPHDTITLFERDIHEERISIQLTRADSPYTRNTPPDTRKITLIFHAPSGPYHVNSNGETRWYAIEISARYRLVGSGNAGWTQWEGLKEKDHGNDRPSSKFWDHTIDVAPGSYEVEVTRDTGDNDDATQRNDVIYWLSMISVQVLGGAEMFPDRVALVAIRVRDQGALGEFNCIAESFADAWEGGQWVFQKSSNPASIFRRVLQGFGLIVNVAENKLDLPSLQSWYTYCKQTGLEFNGVFDRPRPVREILDMICVRGRATFDFVDNQYSVIIDRPQTEPVSALITARNLANLDVQFDTDPIPQVVRVRFRDRDNEWEPDERLVYDDGYNAANADFSTAVVLDLIDSVTSSDQAWREGRWWIAHRRLRRQRVTGTIGLEHLLLRRGSKVAWQHWASLVGIGPGMRIRATTSTTITLDQPVTMQAGKSYGVRIRALDANNDPTFIVREVETVAGTTDVLTFTEPFAAPDVDDLVAFGLLQAETSEMLVLAREPTIIGATIIMTNAAPAIEGADSGPIPAWDPNVTTGGQPGIRPATPEIIHLGLQRNALTGHPDVLRSITLVVTLARYTGRRPQPVWVNIRVREVGSGDTWRIEQYPGQTLIIKYGNVQDGTTYEVQAQALGFSTNGMTLASAWSPRKTIRVPKSDEDGTPALIARVRNLQLLGQGNNHIFGGRDPTLTWSIASGVGGVTLNQLTGGVNSFVDPSFGYYEVQIRTFGTNELRRTERTHEPKYTYYWSRNVEDAQRLGDEHPAASMRIAVTFVDKFQHRSNTARIDISNPAPAAPVVTVTPGLEAVFVQIAPPADADFAGMIVWASSTANFTPGPGNQVARTKGDTHASFKASAGQTFVRVAAYDEFRSDPAQLNISSAVGVTVATASSQPLFAFDNITFTPDASNDRVEWDSGFAIVTNPDGTTSRYAIDAGQATWTTDTLYLYYIAGNSVISRTLDLATATGQDRAALATYRGGTALFNLTATRHKFLAADVILAGTIGAGLIVTDQAVITETIQIANAIITAGKIEDAAITNAKIRDLAVTTIKFADGSVITSKMDFEAATSMRDFYADGTQTVTADTGTFEDLGAITIPDALNLPVAIVFGAKVFAGSPLLTDGDLDIRVLRNATTIFASNDYISNLASDQGERYIVVNIADRTPGSGQREYRVQGRAEAADMNVSRRSMLLIHHKR